MSGQSNSFLTKSIILLGLVLLSMGGSMWIGKQLGGNIMSLTRSNIEERFPDSNGSAEQTDPEYLVGLGNDRSSFGFDSGEFGSNQFPRDWADPTEEQLSVTGDEPVIDITLIDQGAESTVTQDVTSGPDEAGDAPKPGNSEVTRQDGSSVFELGDRTTFRIQVGTYSERENAESVWRDLTQAGYNASISTYNDDDTVRYRVQVGSYHDRSEADAVAEQIRSKGFDAWVYQT